MKNDSETITFKCRTRRSCHGQVMLLGTLLVSYFGFRSVDTLDPPQTEAS